MNTPYALILAGGAGTRMRSGFPKPLHHLGGQPMLSYVLGLAHHVAEKVGVVMSPALCQNFSFPSGVEKFVQHNPKGTGDAVKIAAPLFDNFSGDVFVLFGDTPLLPSDVLMRMQDKKNSANAELVLLGMHLDDPSGYGRIVINEVGEVATILEDRNTSAECKENNFCNAGVMLVSSFALREFLTQMISDVLTQEYYLTDIAKFFYQKGKKVIALDEPPPLLMGINTRAQLAAAETILQNSWRDLAMAGGATLQDPTSVYFSFDTKIGKDVIVEPNVFFGPGVTIADNVTVKACSHIEGTCIGEYSTVGPFARLRPGTAIDKNVRIGNFVEVKQSTLEAGAKINHLSYVGDASVGAATNIGAGTITCNNDGFKKSQTTLGANVFVGSNSCFIAPVCVEDGAIIGAGSVITKNVDQNDMAISRAMQQTIKEGGLSYRQRRK